MQRESDAQLLSQYALTGSEAAFQEIVTRHAAFVYSAALRQIRSADLARDVAQNVFTELAQKASSLSKRLSPESSIAGWLYRATRFESQNLRRAELRRTAREQKAMEDFTCERETVSADWESVRGCLDEAVAELGDMDRDAILLRFFQNQTLRDVGAALGISDDAAQKRITRALETLRRILARRAYPMSAGALSAAISAHAVQATPAGLIQSICAEAIFAQSSAAGTAIASTKTLAMTTMHKTIIGGTFALLIGAGFYQAQQNSRLREQVRTLHATEQKLSDDLKQATNLNASLERQARGIPTVVAESQAPANELLKLRGTVGLNAREIAELKAALANRTGRLPDSVATIVSGYLSSLKKGEAEFQENDAASQLAKISAAVAITPAQQQQVRDILSANVATRTELAVAAESGTLPFEEVRQRRNKLAQEENKAIAALLSPEQAVAYQQWQDQPENPGISNWAYREASRIASACDLTPEQRDKAATIFNSLKPGEGGRQMALYSNAADQLTLRMQALQGLLTDQQAQSYMRMIQQDIDEHTMLATISQALDRTQ